MGESGKVLLLVLFVLYVISPVDACPGPIDDILLTVLVAGGAILRNRLGGDE